MPEFSLGSAILFLPRSPMEISTRETVGQKGWGAILLSAWLGLIGLALWEDRLDPQLNTSLLRDLYPFPNPVWVPGILNVCDPLRPVAGLMRICGWKRKTWEHTSYDIAPLPTGKHGVINVLESKPTRSAFLLRSSPPTGHNALSAPLSKWLWNLSSLLPLFTLQLKAHPCTWDKFGFLTLALRCCVIGLFLLIWPQPLPLSSSLALLQPHGLPVLSSSSPTPPFFYSFLCLECSTPGSLHGWPLLTFQVSVKARDAPHPCSPSSHHLPLFFQSTYCQMKKNVSIYCLFANHLSLHQNISPKKAGTSSFFSAVSLASRIVPCVVLNS